MNKEFEQAKNLINSSSKILLTMHERMDGDDGGSVLALAHILPQQGKEVVCVIKKGVPPSLAFLPGSETIQDDLLSNSMELDSNKFNLLIACGCSSLQRTGSEGILKLKIDPPVGGQKLKIINIDHHPDNQLYGDVNMVDPTKSSVAELVYDFFVFAGWRIDQQIATCLLTGITTDTGSFMHSNTQSSTFKAAAELVKKGALMHEILRHTHKNKKNQGLKAWARAISNSFFDEKNKIIYSVISEQDLNELGQLPQSVFDGLAENLSCVPEAKFAVFLRQEGGSIKGSLRSTSKQNTDVSQLARAFGGGGHKLAAGFTVAGKLVKDEKGKWKII